MKILRNEKDKLRGGYYTSQELAEWLCDWAIRDGGHTVFEPSCGDGVFIRAAGSRFLKLGVPRNKMSERLHGVELVGEEADKARQNFINQFKTKSPPDIETSDLFQWLLTRPMKKQFDVVVGNPPFIRYQNFPEPSRSLAMDLMNEHGLRPNKLTNIWVPFIVASTVCLRPGGRLAMVVPAELLQVTYAAQLRMFLVDRFQRIEIVTCNEMLFQSAEQEVVLLLADGKLETASPDNRCLINMSEFDTVTSLLGSRPVTKTKTKKFIQHDSEKWLKYFLTAEEIEFMRKLRQNQHVAELKNYASVDVGVVTGSNDFFVLNREQASGHGLEEYSLPLVGRSAQLEGAIFSRNDLKTLAQENSRVYLFYVPPDTNGSLSRQASRYIAQGEADRIHHGYKCSIRTPWFTVPSVWKPDCFLFRQIYDFPRAVVNQTKATSTDTIHRMTCKVDPSVLAAGLYTHLTGASSEIEGRSYGGGVLELEPTEAERLLVPKALGYGLSIEEIDERIRAGGLEDVLRENDRLILKNQLGFSDADCKILSNIWNKMRTRRRMRGKRK